MRRKSVTRKTPREKTPTRADLERRGELVLRKALQAVTHSKRTYLLKVRPRQGAKLQVELALIGDAAMRRLNAQFRGKDQPTDVLSFPAPVPFQEAGVLGSLVLAQGVMKRQAREMKHSLWEELEVLIVHGVLHLLGWDHERSPREAREMALREAKLLSKLRARSRARGLISRGASG